MEYTETVIDDGKQHNTAIERRRMGEEVVTLDKDIDPEWFEVDNKNPLLDTDALLALLLDIKHQRAQKGNTLTTIKMWDKEGKVVRGSSENYREVLSSLTENGDLLGVVVFPGHKERHWNPRFWKRVSDGFAELKLKPDLRFETSKEWQDSIDKPKLR